MILGLLKETEDRRVALVPDTIKKIGALGIEVQVERTAGEEALYADQAYTEHASVVSREQLLSSADMLVSIHPPPRSDMEQMKPDTVLISQFAPFNDPDITAWLRKHQLRGLSMDMIPRTTLAQSMDVLSSMAAVAGYKAVLEAAKHLPRYFPMMITAAGSIRPAKVLVLGAGVAGLQAIATARRLGAMVEAFDTRSAAKEEVLSLGAKFVEVEGASEDTGAGGYAVAQSEEFLQRQRAEVQSRAVKADVVITTAQVRGRKAPLLLPASTVEKMQPGSVVVDLASSTGGNCELSQNDAVIQAHGVTIVGNSQLAGLMPQHASLLYSNNVFHFLKILIKDGELHLDTENEIIRGAYFTASPENS